MPLLLGDCPDCGAPIYDIEGQERCPKCGKEIPEWLKERMGDADVVLPESFGKVPDIRHPDTALLDWMQRRWSDDEGCPITWDGDSFVPICESGVWPADMTLRQAIHEAMKQEEENAE